MASPLSDLAFKAIAGVRDSSFFYFYSSKCALLFKLRTMQRQLLYSRYCSHSVGLAKTGRLPCAMYFTSFSDVNSTLRLLLLYTRMRLPWPRKVGLILRITTIWDYLRGLPPLSRLQPTSPPQVFDAVMPVMYIIRKGTIKE